MNFFLILAHSNDRCASNDECRGDEICKLLTTGIRDCVGM